MNKEGCMYGWRKEVGKEGRKEGIRNGRNGWKEEKGKLGCMDGRKKINK